MTAAMGNAYIKALRVSIERGGGKPMDAEQLAEEFRQQFRMRGKRLEAAGDQPPADQPPTD